MLLISLAVAVVTEAYGAGLYLDQLQIQLGDNNLNRGIFAFYEIRHRRITAKP